MSALETIQGLLIDGSVPPLHSDQVHLMAAATTSSAPVPTQTKSPPVKNAGSSTTGSGHGLSWWLGAVVAVGLGHLTIAYML